MIAPLGKGKASSVVFDGVTKTFGRGAVTAVDNVSFTVNAGELVTFLGPSGCGKTTTLRMIAGLEMATSGRILIGERDVTKVPATDRDVSMVFQSYALFPHMNVIENVAYGLRMSSTPKSELKERAEAGLELVGLSDYGPRLPSELSGGQQQRVAVARALVLEPEVLLFDEPLSNLDAKLRRKVREEIRDIQLSLGLTVVYVTHDQEEALAVSDRIVVMKNASIAQIGTPHELYDLPTDAFVADFIGEANLLPCEVQSVSADGTAQVKAGSMSLSLEGRDLEPGPAFLAIRPRRIRFDGGANPSLASKVTKATYVGSHMEYHLETELGELFAIADTVGGRVAEGEEIQIDVAESRPILVRKQG